MARVGPSIIPSPPAWKSKLVTVGVTGTNGKTSTTAWIAAALAATHRPVPRTTTVGAFIDDEPASDLPRDYNGFVALMKRGLDRGARFAAVEYTSEALALGFAKAWPADVAVFTNLSHDHLDSHGTPEHYLASKAQLFMALPSTGAAVLNAADPASELLREILPGGVRRASYAVGSRGKARFECDVAAREVTVDWDGTRIVLDRRGLGEGLPEVVTTRAVGHVYAENVLGALLGCVLAGVDPSVATRAIADHPAPPGRFEVIARKPYVVVDYAHTPDALARTLDIARALAETSAAAERARVIVVFGAGGNRDKNKRAPMGQAASRADTIVLTSDNPRSESAQEIADQIRKGITGDSEVQVELDRKRAIAFALSKARDQDIVIIAGRGHETEQLIGDQKLAFSDVEVARDLLAGR